MSQAKRIALMGMKHTGKSTLGSILAGRLGLPFFDTDALIADLAGKSARELFDEGGAPLMMRWETEACRRALTDETGKGVIVSTGGGLADNAEAIDLLREAAFCVYIDTPFDILFARVMRSARRDDRLPRFLQGGDPEALFRALYDRRSKIYGTIANATIDAGSRTPESLVAEIMGMVQHGQ